MMKLALYGGAFDPIHKGHLTVAEAARQAFALDRVLLAPNSHPPHKAAQAADYEQRAAMIALATRRRPSLELCRAESPEALRARGARRGYSVETIERLRLERSAGDLLFFLIGADAFADIAKWRRADELLRMCDFIVVSRPDYELSHALEALPESLRSLPFRLRRRAFASWRVTTAACDGVRIHLLDGVRSPVSSTHVREAARAGRDLSRLTGADVARYISEHGLYR